MQFDIFYSYTAAAWRWIIVNPKQNGKIVCTGSRTYGSSATCRAAARKFFDQMRGPSYVIFNVIPREKQNALRPAKRY
jgi:hypothetical protein